MLGTDFGSLDRCSSLVYKFYRSALDLPWTKALLFFIVIYNIILLISQ